METGLTVVDHSHVSLYLTSELIPGAATFNDIVSRALSDRHVWRSGCSGSPRSFWSRRFEKPSSSHFDRSAARERELSYRRELALDQAAPEVNVVIDDIIDAYPVHVRCERAWRSVSNARSRNS